MSGLCRTREAWRGSQLTRGHREGLQDPLALLDRDGQGHIRGVGNLEHPHVGHMACKEHEPAQATSRAGCHGMLCMSKLDAFRKGVGRP